MVPPLTCWGLVTGPFPPPALPPMLCAAAATPLRAVLGLLVGAGAEAPPAGCMQAAHPPAAAATAPAPPEAAAAATTAARGDVPTTGMPAREPWQGLLGAAPSPGRPLPATLPGWGAGSALRQDPQLARWRRRGAGAATLAVAGFPACTTAAAARAAPGGASGGGRWHRHASSLAPGSDILEGRGKTVAVGISGGVDSAVAALLLKARGYDVVGVFMRNWDEGEEVGNQNCSVERDLRDAQAVCRQLGVPLHEADFVAQYWTRVFQEFLAQCGRGLSPNPDLACNRHIKFDALLEFAGALGAPLVATGHYARLRHTPSPAGAAAVAGEGAGAGAVQLLRGIDHRKDQSYFLASVQPQALERVLFPVGGMRKEEVRRLAAEQGLLPADRRSSAGICFIGRRSFGDFLQQYLPPVPGTFVSVDGGQQLGPCANILTVTHGQRPGIGGAAGRMYVVGKDVESRVVYVCQGQGHPALLTRTALLRAPHWLSVAHQRQLEAQGWLRCQYKARYAQQPKPCTLYPAAAAAAASTGAGVAEGASGCDAFRPSAFTRLQPGDTTPRQGYLVARFDEPALAITPQQAFVAYDGEVCLGSALIALPGQTLQEEGQAA